MIFYLTSTRIGLITLTMMFRYPIEPVNMWGLEPCEGILLPSFHTSVKAGGAVTRRTHPGLGAAYSRSNVAEQFSFFNGRQFRRRKGDYYDTPKRTSSATALSSKTLLALVVYSYCWVGALSGFLVSFIRSGLNATSKIASRKRL